MTHILEALAHGDLTAAEELLPLVYEELRKLAAYKMAHSAAGHTLQPTGLVLRYFVGMTIPEIAEALEISTRSADRHWVFARAWLKGAIRRG